MKKALVILLAVLMLSSVALLAAGCQQTPAQPGGQPGGQQPGGQQPGEAGETTLILATASPPGALDPALENDQPTSRITRQIFQTLVYQDENMDIVPGLAESWEFIDERTVRFTLREGVRFHNGDILTAEDVVFSINRASVAPRVAIITQMIEEAIAVDARTVDVRTEFPFAPILSHLAHPATGIVNKAVVEALGDDGHAQAPVGTGPFMFYRLVAGDRVELVRFDDFNSVVPGLAPGQLPAMEHIIIRIIPEASVRAIEVEAGTAHLAYDLASSDLHRLAGVDTVNVHMIPTLSLGDYIGFNMLVEPFDDIRVRKAINYALDLETIIDVVYEGIGSPGVGPLTRTVWGANTDLEMWPFDIARARELMAEAGLEDGFSTTLMHNEGNPRRLAVAEIVQTQLRALNIDIAIRIYEMPVYLEMTAAGEHEMFILGWVSVTGDPDYGLWPTFHSTSFGAPGNRTFYANDRVDYLLEIGRTSSDPNARLAAYHEAQQIIRDEVPWIFLWQGSSLEASRADVRGFRPSPAGHHALWTVYIP